jgi:hypothetical protein
MFKSSPNYKIAGSSPLAGAEVQLLHRETPFRGRQRSSSLVRHVIDAGSRS